MKRLIPLLIFSLFQFTSNAQVKPIAYNTRIIYKFTFQNDSTAATSRKSIFTQLMIGDNESHFQTVSKFQKDSALSSVGSSKMFYYSYGGINPNSFIIVKKEDVIQTYEPVNGVGFSGNNQLSFYEQKKDELRWEIHPDTLTNHTFVCQKATTTWGGRKWTAWFTMEIPIPDGPYKFCGLPGLVISISDQDKYFTFDLISINKVKKPSLSFDKIRPDFVLQKTTIAAFYKERKKLRENMVEYGLMHGSRFTEEQKRSINLQAKADNNFIERY